MTDQHQLPFGPWYHLSGCIVTSKVGPDWAAHTVAVANTELDAQRISALPELLDAALELLSIVEFETACSASLLAGTYENDTEPEDLGSWREAIALANAAIDKANFFVDLWPAQEANPLLAALAQINQICMFRPYAEGNIQRIADISRAAIATAKGDQTP